MTSPDLSPGSSPWDTNRTNRTRSSGGKYESVIFLRPAFLIIVIIQRISFEAEAENNRIVYGPGLWTPRWSTCYMEA